MSGSNEENSREVGKFLNHILGIMIVSAAWQCTTGENPENIEISLNAIANKVKADFEVAVNTGGSVTLLAI